MLFNKIIIIIITVEVIVEGIFVSDVGGGGTCRRLLIIMDRRKSRSEFGERFIGIILVVVRSSWSFGTWRP
jgi:hypothetical protein